MVFSTTFDFVPFDCHTFQNDLHETQNYYSWLNSLESMTTIIIPFILLISIYIAFYVPTIEKKKIPKIFDILKAHARYIWYIWHRTKSQINNLFISFFYLRFPFDEHTPIGYIVFSLLVAAFSYVILYTMTSALIMFIAVFILAMSIIADVREHFKSFNEVYKHPVKMVEWIRELHSVHSSTLEFVVLQ